MRGVWTRQWRGGVAGRCWAWFDDKTVRICYHLDLGWEKKETRPLPSLLSRAEGRRDGAPWLRGCFCFPGTRAAPGSSSVGSADSSRINEGMDSAKHGGDLPHAARPALRVPRPSVLAEVLMPVSGQSPAFR